ncbi:MAG: DUF4159 domain-containing protein [Chthoniobacterales bacterium]
MKNDLIERIIDKFSSSRDFTISFVLHVILVAVFGTAVLFDAASEPPDFEGEGGGFVQAGDASSAPPPVQPAEQTPQIDVTQVSQAAASNPLSAITTTSQNALSFSMPAITTPSVAPPTTTTQTVAASVSQQSFAGVQGLTAQGAASIKAFTGGWGKGSGRGTGSRQREFEFIAFMGQYSGGNWNSTVQLGSNKKIIGGSLPNLLWIMGRWSRDKIKTNERNVQAIRLDSGELFSIKPPFIFLTGTRDFKLTDKEVENLQKYVRMGGCIWGDSSLPGSNSRFDIAFRREMRRVIPDVDKQFKPLPPNHPIYTSGYFPEIKETPPGINYYQEPVYALEIYGQIGILYTANDYGDMWQIGLMEDGTVDLRRDERSRFVAINRNLWDARYTYLGNITPPPAKAGKPNVATNIEDTYKFGINIIVHLLTRWESITARAPSL